jgi:hypothetical protein
MTRTNWVDSIQKLEHGFRPGIKVKMITGGSKTGKSVLLDLDSLGHHPFSSFRTQSEINRPHYAEYADRDTGGTYWKKHDRLPLALSLYSADNIIRHNEDGSYEYIKNRGQFLKNRNTTGSTVNANDMAWIILAATAA